MIIYFPHKLGQLKNGVQKTPFHFKKILKNNSITIKCNNSKQNIKNMANNLHKLYNCNQMIQGRKINIGGDHSMSIATVADSLNRYRQNKLKVLWFDAHPDINTYESSISKNFHGMPLAYLTGLCSSNYFPFIVNKLNFNNIMYVGIRDIDDYEKQIIDEYNIKYISCDEINNNVEQSLDKIFNFIDNNHVHLSFDVDSMEPSIIPCTGTRYNGGLNLINTKRILDKLVDTNIVNIDITEINLELGDKEERKKTISNTLHLFDKYLDY
jgi:arginase